MPSPLVVPRRSSITLSSDNSPSLFFKADSLFIKSANISIKNPAIAAIPRYSVIFSLRNVVLLSYISIAFSNKLIPCVLKGLKSIIIFKPYISVSTKPALEIAYSLGPFIILYILDGSNASTTKKHTQPAIASDFKNPPAFFVLSDFDTPVTRSIKQVKYG